MSLLDRLQRKLFYSRPFRNLIAWGQRIVLPGFEGFSVYAVSRLFIKALADGHLVTRASAISFKLFIAFFPAVLVLLTLIPFIPIEDFQTKMMLNLRNTMPLEVYKFIESTLTDLLVKKHSTLLSISFLVGIYLASNSMDAILEGFSQSTHLHTWHSPLKQRLLSLGLIVGISIMVLLAVIILTVSDTVILWAQGQGLIGDDLTLLGIYVAKYAISLLLIMGSISLLYNAGDPLTRRFRFFTPGAIVATFLFVLVAQGLAFVFSHFTDYNALYGSIGAILAVQLWLYFNMLALLFGYELNTSILRARLGRSKELRVH